MTVVFAILWGLTLKGSKGGGPMAEGPEGAGDHYAELRRRMVETQIVARGIKDERVIKAMLKVPRHEFVPLEYRHMAYNDHPLPIGFGQTISQPYIVALMTEALELKPTDKVLEVGTGSGYQAAILGEICREVYTIEIIPELAERAKRTLKRLGYRNVFVKCGDGFLGWPEKAPFDAIIVTCAAPFVPPPLVQQLAEGGRLVIPVGADPYQVLMRLRKVRGRVKFERMIECLFVPMTGEGVRRWRVPPEAKEGFGEAVSALDEITSRLWPDRRKRLDFWCSLPVDSPEDLLLLGPSLSVRALEYVKGLGAKVAVVPASVEALVKAGEVYRALRDAAKASGVLLALIAVGVGPENFDKFSTLSRDLLGEVPVLAPLSRGATKLAELWPKEVLTYARPGSGAKAVYLSNEIEVREALEEVEGGASIEVVVCGRYERGWLRRVRQPGPWRAVLDGKLARAGACLASKAGARRVVLLPGRALLGYPEGAIDLPGALREGRKSALYGALRTLIEEFGFKKGAQ